MRRPVIITALLLGTIFLLIIPACSAGDEPLAAGGENLPAAADDQVGIPAAGSSAPGEAGATGAGETVDGRAADGVLLIGLGVHIEPFGAEVSSLAGGADGAAGTAGLAPGADYTNPQFFSRHVAELETLAAIVEGHAGVMTVQAQSPFTSEAIRQGETVLADLADSGHEIGLHFHEDAHLGADPEELAPEAWCAVMEEEISLVEQAAGIEDVRYWSGGNLYPGLLEAASCAGLDVNSDWKNPQEQSIARELDGTQPWRPAGGSNGNDVSRFAAHDVQGEVIFLPNGQFSHTGLVSERRSGKAGGEEAYFDYLQESLMASLAEAQVEPGRVHVFHFTIHPGEFRGDPEHPYAVLEQFLTEVVDPLVASGQVSWATFSGMADAYADWEQAHPGQDPRGSDGS